MSNTAEKLQQKTEATHVYVYQEIYDGLAELVGNPSQMLQTFMHSNNADTIKSIEFWRGELNKASEVEKTEIESIIRRLKNIMKLRVGVTEDLMSTEAPQNFLYGPKKTVEQSSEEKKEVKTIEHPASKGKVTTGKTQQKTVNDKYAEEKAQKAEEKKTEDEQVEEAVRELSLPSYHDLYPLDEEKVADINDNLIPNLQKYLHGEKQNDNNALLMCRLHFRNFGTIDRFYSDTAIVRFFNWLKSGKFQSRSPLAVLKGDPLSLTDIIREVEELIVEGSDRKAIRNYVAEEVINVQLKEQKEAISTERDFIKFFQSTLQYLFDEDQQRRLKAKASKSAETREIVKKNLLILHREARGKFNKMAKDLREWLVEQGEKTNIQSALAEMLAFIKSADPKLYKEYMDTKGKSKKNKSSNGGDKKETKNEENKEKSDEEDDAPVAKRKADVTPSPVVFPKLEDSLKYKDKKSLLTEFLQTIANKKVSPIGNKVNGMDGIIEDLTKLAKKRILEMGLKKDKDGKTYDDWTEQDVSNYMAEEVVPFITDGYSILKAENEKELKESLSYYTNTYPSGKEKERYEKMQEVLTSEVPRSNYMKRIARKVRKGNMQEVNAFVAQIIKGQDEELNKTKEKE